MNRMEYIQHYVKEAVKLKGDLAEAGVSKGASAEAICLQKGEKTLHLFDTFTGLPLSKFTGIDVADAFSRRYIFPNAYEAPIEEVKARLSGYNNIVFHEGIIPQTFKGLGRKRYCFIHIDLDLYLSTIEALNYFLPRRVDGGIIMIHNYHDFKGVRKAIEDAGVSKVEKGDHKYCFL